MRELSAIKRIEMASRQIPGVVSLAQGTPSLYSDKAIRQAVIQAIEENKVDKYSPGAGIPELRKEISRQLAREGMDYDAEGEILVTAGAIEALSAVFLALLQKGNEVVVLTPTYYANYESIIEMAGGVAVEVQLEEQEGWQLDFEKLKAALTPQTKAVLLCNPNNPTGSILSKEELTKLGQLAKERNLLLVFDDVYHHLVYGKELFCLATEGEYKDSIIRIVSFSKTFALTGWRIGFLHGPRELVAHIVPMHDNLLNCAPVVSQYAALAALQHEKEIVPKVVEEYRKRRELMGGLLQEMKDYLSFVAPEGAYYFFPKIHGVANTMDFAFEVLEKAKVAVVPGEDFGPGGEGHIRLCFGRAPEDIEEGLSRLKAYFEDLK